MASGGQGLPGRGWRRSFFQARLIAGLVSHLRAEVVHCEDFIACGSEAKARESGKWCLEGKDYRVVDGDVVFFRHG